MQTAFFVSCINSLTLIIIIIVIQVLEMDGLLRSHQADTTARRLQLERSLAQRQADLRTRTQELEEVTIKYSDAQKTIEEFRKKITQLESAGHTQTNTNKRELQTKVCLCVCVCDIQCFIVTMFYDVRIPSSQHCK